MEYQKGTTFPGGDIAPSELLRQSMPEVIPETEDAPDMESGCGCGCQENTCSQHSCGCRQAPCGEDSWGLNTHPLAMVYAPCQTFRNLYDTETALSRGTLFSELDFPLEVIGGNGCGNSCGGRIGNGCGRSSCRRGH